MRDQGIGSWPRRRARNRGRHPALVYGAASWTYADLAGRVARLAYGLRDLGIGPGDRVAYLGWNHPALLETLFATASLGAVFVPLNARLAVPELAYIVEDAGPRVLVHGPEHAATAAELRPGTSLVHTVAVPPGDGDQPYTDLLAGPPREIDEEVAPGDLCMIMYTSGTTGRPKGAALTHANVTWNAMNVLADVDLRADEVTLVTAPLFHTAALNMTCLPTLVKGGRVVIAPGFDPDATFDLIAAHRVTFAFGVPAMFNTLAASPRWPDADLSSLRVLECGGAPVPEATIRAYSARGLTFLQGYGMTEAAPGALFLTRGDALRKAGTAGTAQFFTDVRVVRPDGPPSDEAAPGEPGEIIVSGPNVMSGYWRLPDATAEVLTGDGWFRTGDVGVADDDGYVRIADRIKDMIISGGENVYPAEVENSLYDHPDIAECAVVGVPDDRWGEVGRAFVVPRPGTEPATEALLAHVRERLAAYKVPKSVVFLGELPRTPSGKIIKSELRKRADD
jgi:fatty-acyl-CoA synthase